MSFKQKPCNDELNISNCTKPTGDIAYKTILRPNKYIYRFTNKDLTINYTELKHGANFTVSSSDQNKIDKQNQ